MLFYKAKGAFKGLLTAVTKRGCENSSYCQVASLGWRGRVAGGKGVRWLGAQLER